MSTTGYAASILADSISPGGVRLTTFQTCWPHATHKDFMTHRDFSRNFESFRARPTDVVAAAIQESPFLPDAFAARVAGMAQGEELPPAEQQRIRALWLQHIENACELVGEMSDIAKQQANFLLQDFAWINGVVTATNWDNFFALRTELKEDGTPMARPEVYQTAMLMREAYEASTPRQLKHGEWHLPLVDDDLIHQTVPEATSEFQEFDAYRWLAMVSAGRCARISYGFKAGEEDPSKSHERAVKLLSNGHMSPFEHQARPFNSGELEVVDKVRRLIGDAEVCGVLQPVIARGMVRQIEHLGNVRGWVQLRKTLPWEENYGALQFYGSDESLLRAAA